MYSPVPINITLIALTPLIISAGVVPLAATSALMNIHARSAIQDGTLTLSTVELAFFVYLNVNLVHTLTMEQCHAYLVSLPVRHVTTRQVALNASRGSSYKQA